MTPEWTATAIWWSVYPLGACGAPVHTPDVPGVHHRLSRVESWLDHVVGLGCNGVALGPVWASSSHGYDILDHLRVDPRLGDEADLAHLATACHERGVRLLLDGVFNHVSVDHPWVRATLADRSSPYAKMLKADPARPDGLARFEGHDALVELDHACPEVADYVVTVMNHWLDRGADGWRLDAAYRIPPEFWTSVLARVRDAHPQSLTLAEILHGDYAAIAERSGFDSVTQYELWKAIWSGLKDRNSHEMAWALERHAVACATQIPWIFVGNHDVTRIATQIGVGGARVATAALMTLPGTPALYYGDEFGWTGLKEDRPGGDDAIRPPMDEHPGPATPEQAETLRHTQLAIRVRRTHPGIAQGTARVLSCTYRRLSWRTETPTGDWVQADLDLTADPVLAISDATGEILRVTA